MNIKKEIEKVVGRNNGYLLGFADMKGLLPAQFAGFRYAIVLGKKLDDRIMNEVMQGPTQEYYEHYGETNRALAALVRRVGERLSGLDSSISYHIIEPTIDDEELATIRETLRYAFSHKMAATRAGLGWIGKTDLFISERFGPRLRLATILVDCTFPLAADSEPVNESKCGACRVCVEKCPANAANGKLWKKDIDREEFFDAFKCRAMCLEQTARRLGTTHYICGICVAVCPQGKRASG